MNNHVTFSIAVLSLDLTSVPWASKEGDGRGVAPVDEISGGCRPESLIVQYHILHFYIFQHFENYSTIIREETKI